jgi:hypothetical protein
MLWAVRSTIFAVGARMRHQEFRRAILQLLYERAVEMPPSLIAGIEAAEIAQVLGMTAREFAFNALYLDTKGFITNDRSAIGGEYHFNAIMITPTGIDMVENPTDMDRHVPLTPRANSSPHPHTRARRRPSASS